MRKLGKQKVIILALVCIGLCTAIFFVFMHSQAEARYYHCKYQDGAAHVRCMDVGGESFGCYPSYTLRGKSVKEGITVGGPVLATCEGLIFGNEVYFDKQGNFVD